MSVTGPLGSFASIVLRPASWAFGAVVTARNARFDRGAGVRRLPLPVISIGNVTVGGTGKTPMVAWAAQSLERSGRRPAIAMRGYAAAPGERADEEREYALTVPGVPVIANPDRFAAVTRFLRERPGAIDCVILDDGFQHRHLARDLDVVLVDSMRPALDDPLLPCGWLREPPRGLRRASAVIVTRTERIDVALARRIESLHGRPPLAWCRHEWRGIDVHFSGEMVRRDVSWLEGKRVLGVFGVGNPRALRVAYESAGAQVAAEVAARDHARHERSDVERWADVVASDRLDAIVTTPKDWTKIAPLVSKGLPPIVVPDLAVTFLEGEAEFARMLAAVAQPRS